MPLTSPVRESWLDLYIVPTAAWVGVDVQGLCWHQRLHRWPGSGSPAMEGLLPIVHTIVGTISVSVTQSQPGSSLMSKALASIEGHADIQDLGCHLKSYVCYRVMCSLGPFQFEWPALPTMAMMTFWPGLLKRTMTWSGALQQSRWVLMYMASVMTMSLGLQRVDPIHYLMKHRRELRPPHQLHHPGQHSRADPFEGVAGDPTLWT